jgi:hypothetical protein
VKSVDLTPVFFLNSEPETVNPRNVPKTLEGGVRLFSRLKKFYKV